MNSALIQLVAKAALALTLAVMSTGSVHANELKNGCFTDPKGSSLPKLTNVVLFPANGQHQSGPSAAPDWTQVKVVGDSYLETWLQLLGGGPQRVLHVKTNGGVSPLKTDQQGNGIWQGLAKPLTNVKITYGIIVNRGSVTGGLVLASGPFKPDTPTFVPLIGNKSAVQYFKGYPKDPNDLVSAVAFESLNGPNTTNHAGADYEIACVYVEPYRAITLLDLKSLKYLVDTSPISTKNPASPTATIRVTNQGTATIKGPIQILLEDLTTGFSVLSPSGSYLGTPFITLSSNAFGPGKSESVTVRFSAGAAGTIPAFRPHLVSFGE